jgi:hypothetical protein
LKTGEYVEAKDNKKIFVYKGSLMVPRTELVKKTLDLLDRYLVPVKINATQ